MKTVFLATALLAVAACNQTDAPANGPETQASADLPLTGDAPGFEAVAPGDYTVERANGEIDTITIHPGMTYSRVAADGTATGGTIFMQDGKTCFVVEGVDGQNCFTDGPVQPDGSMQTTSDAGAIATVRPADGSASTTATGGNASE
ncbi:hypothetical protein [Alteraurantiacibacter buctensis]|uniref:Lipoprotein n=1 Tax=Alteraurantiacibacter buctensis TaxID=1503981 RepID=A0A844YXK9_9SPHN|nr:hypothetical protein [Alteraurantiacibacter buctensis]MXO72299.1 hypothetical protein [Alteraurantiacibacter buctensis]